MNVCVVHTTIIAVQLMDKIEKSGTKADNMESDTKTVKKVSHIDWKWGHELLIFQSFNTLKQRHSFKISLKFDPEGSINNIPALVEIMAWSQSGDNWAIISINEGLVHWHIYASLGLNE